MNHRLTVWPWLALSNDGSQPITETDWPSSDRIIAPSRGMSRPDEIRVLGLQPIAASAAAIEAALVGAKPLRSLVEIFPEFWKRGDLRVEDIAPMSATLRLIHHPRHLRPGGAISGPTTFGVCDTALFVAILGEIGRVAHAVTTSASINFLRKPAPADLIGHAKLIKLGKRLAVGEVALYSEGESEMVAHATGTYSIPARGEAAAP